MSTLEALPSAGTPTRVLTATQKVVDGLVVELFRVDATSGVIVHDGVGGEFRIPTRDRVQIRKFHGRSPVGSFNRRAYGAALMYLREHAPRAASVVSR